MWQLPPARAVDATASDVGKGKRGATWRKAWGHGCLQNGQGRQNRHPGRQGPAEVVLGEGPSETGSLAWMPGVLAKGQWQGRDVQVLQAGKGGDKRRERAAERVLSDVPVKADLRQPNISMA